MIPHSRFYFAATHFLPTNLGVIRNLHRKRFWPILIARWNFFAMRKPPRTLITPEGFSIGSVQELVSYWGMYVERDLWDPEWIKPLQAAVAPIVIDVGANYGLFCHLIRRLNTAAKIFAFEPQPRFCQLIRSMNIPCSSIALSDRKEKATLHLSPGQGETASLTDYADSGREMEIETDRLDDIWDRDQKPVLVKIDVDGFECNVVKGGQRVLGEVPFIIVEIVEVSSVPIIDQMLPRHRRRKISAIDYLYSLR